MITGNTPWFCSFGHPLNGIDNAFVSRHLAPNRLLHASNIFKHNHHLLQLPNSKNIFGVQLSLTKRWVHIKLIIKSTKRQGAWKLSWRPSQVDVTYGCGYPVPLAVHISWTNHSWLTYLFITPGCSFITWLLFVSPKTCTPGCSPI